MKLDMLDALEQATQALGSNTRIYASNVFEGVAVSVECFKSNKHYAVQFTVSHTQLIQDDYQLMNKEFRRALQELKRIK